MLRLDLLLLDNKLWHDDMPRVTAGRGRDADRAAPGRPRVANAWGTLAIEKFARAFESVPVTGNDHGVARGGLAEARLGARSERRKLWTFHGRRRRADLHVDHIRHRKSVGADSGARRDSAQGAVLERLPDHANAQRRWMNRIAGGWRHGDLVRVHLKIDAQSDMTWVVVNDPIPAGASHLGTGLRRDSAIATARRKRDDARHGVNNDSSGPTSSSGPSTPFAPTTTTFRRATSRSSTRSGSTRPACFRCRRRGSRRCTSPRCSARFPTRRSMSRQ